MGLSIYALFFVLAGAHLHIQVQIKTIGFLGLGYLIARTVGIIYSSKLAAKITGEFPVIQKYMGLSVLSHAGAALAIVAKLKGSQDPSALAIINVVMASIFFFEIVGPLLLRSSLLKAGEVRLVANLEKVTSRPSVPLFDLVRNFLHNLGLFSRRAAIDPESIKPLINRDVVAIDENARFNEIINFVDKHHLPIYPIVNKAFLFQGLISLVSLREAITQETHETPVIAKTLIGRQEWLSEESTIPDALSSFAEYASPVLPVVNPESGRMIGTLSYKDIVIAMNVKKV